MFVYRITKGKYADRLSGEGARLTGGRWNSKGTPVIYCASGVALATLEVLVHFPLNIAPKNLVLVEIDCPDSLTVERVGLDRLEEKWNNYPPSGYCAVIGDQWCAAQSSPILTVPSVIIQNELECNYLLNPNHPDFNRISITKISPYFFDRRLVEIDGKKSK